jgi:biotin-dependent carboxylase-like uncharacterized protein
VDRRALEVVATGPLVTVQDPGRPGLAHLAVSPAGAADAASLALANRVVGNGPAAAGLEATLGGLVVRALGPVVVAVAGATAPITVDGIGQGAGHALVLRAGSVLALGLPVRGVRSYLAVRGGIDVPPVLGSRSTDTLSGLGPAPVADGDVLAVGAEPTALPAADQVPLAPPPEVAVLRVRLGPRQDWFWPQAQRRLTSTSWTVRPESDRVGVRLDGPMLARSRPEELPSEGLVTGAVQVPADGRPLIFGVDHPTTGGYPVLAVVQRADHDVVGQLRAGQEVRFVTH